MAGPDKPQELVRLSTPFWDYLVACHPLRSGRSWDYHYVRPADSVMVVPILADGRVVMVRQMRVPTGLVSLEFPGGGIHAGEEPESAARRELHEETGYRAGTIRRLGRVTPCNGLSSEICTIFVAEGLVAGAATPDEAEDIELLALLPDEVDRALRSDQPLDGVTLAAWFLLPGRKDAVRADGG